MVIFTLRKFRRRFRNAGQATAVGQASRLSSSCFGSHVFQSRAWNKTGEKPVSLHGQIYSRRATALFFTSPVTSLSVARPHPNPLPRGEGTAIYVAEILICTVCNRRHRFIWSRNHTATKRHASPKRAERFPLSPGERAGERASVKTKFATQPRREQMLLKLTP